MYDGQNRQILHWLRYVLVEKLEPQFPLCIPDRDFELGTVESEEVVKRINMSKRSLLLLSKDSLDDEKLLYMFQRAYFRMTVEDSRHRIIVVLSDDLDVQEALDNPRYEDNIKAFLTTKEYLVMDSKRFWQKLLYKMPQPPETVAEENVVPLCTVRRDHQGVPGHGEQEIVAETVLY